MTWGAISEQAGQIWKLAKRSLNKRNGFRIPSSDDLKKVNPMEDSFSDMNDEIAPNKQQILPIRWSWEMIHPHNSSSNTVNPIKSLHDSQGLNPTRLQSLTSKPAKLEAHCMIYASKICRTREVLVKKIVMLPLKRQLALCFDYIMGQ